MGVWDYSKAAAVITTSPTPILDALGCQYGVPTCVLNFTKAALGAFPSPALNTLREGISEGVSSAEDDIKAFTMALFLDSGIISYDTNLGKFVFRSISNSGALGGDLLQSAENMKGFGKILGYGAEAYLIANSISDQIEDIKECVDKFSSFLGLQKGVSANAHDLVGFTSIDPITGQPVEYKAPPPALEAASQLYEEKRESLENAAGFVEKCNQQLVLIREVMKERYDDPETNPEPVFDAKLVNDDPTSPWFGRTLEDVLDGRTTYNLSDSLEVDDPFDGRPEIIYAEGQKPPIARKGLFLYSQNGVYYDLHAGGLNIPDDCPESIVSAVYFDERGDPYSPNEIPDAAVKWMLDYNPNLGGKGTYIDLNTFNEYANTIFDISKVNNSINLQGYYEEDHFLQVLLDQRNREIYDLSSYVGQMLGGAYTEDSAEVTNARETIYSKIAAHDSKVNRRKKQIEVVVALTPDGLVPAPGHIPINDLTSLDGSKIGIAKGTQEDIMFSPGEVSGIVMPLCPNFTNVEISKEKFSFLDMMVPSVGIGQIITSDPDVNSTSGTTLGLQDAIIKEGLVSVYNFLDADIVIPSSKKYLSINCSVSSVSEKPAQLVASSIDSLFPSGIGIPYFRGVCNLFSGTDGNPKAIHYSDNEEYLHSAYHPYGYATLKNGFDEVDSLFYKRSGVSFETWLHVPDLGTEDGAGWAADSTTSSLTRVALGCENRGGIAANATGGLVVPPDHYGTSVRGLLVGFSRDRRLTRDLDPTNNPADNLIADGVSFGIFPTQSYNTSTVSFLTKTGFLEDCEEGRAHSAEGYFGTRVDVNTSVSGVKFGDVSSSFMLATITVDYAKDEVNIFLNGNKMATSSVFDTFGTKEPPRIPSKLDASSFRYDVAHEELPATTPRFPPNRVGQKDFWYWNGPNVFDRHRLEVTPYILGGGYTDGMHSRGTEWYQEGTNIGMNFMGGAFGGKKSGLHGYMGSVKFYSRPLTETEIQTNYKAQTGFFGNIRL